MARCDKPVDAQTMKKIALFCNVKPDCVIENRTLPILYGAPVMLRDAGLDRIVLRELHLPGADTPCDLTHWEEMLGRIQNAARRCGSRLSANMSSCTIPTCR